MDEKFLMFGGVTVENISCSHDLASVSLSREELLVLNSALNEICNGIEIFEFETRVGADHEFVVSLLQKIGFLLDDMDQQVS
ncbi:MULTISPECIES: hypothetical protein [Pseudomonas syringae group]|uniref:Uncharacterized protein n=1 Tax=Pseudomonas lijiangensis TaxID=2995658 RepID=A0ABX8HXD0_9PSED|nr:MULTISPECIES: hypothetical protein [Pseudomonas syringae group]MBX8487843.1 hypothetical protein [Pseudomonas cichorii]MBX8501540.1 hypothetical protein [Pseudomonas lijiangensis]MBX8506498.1 hypothetical protein [Pseudomonas lijiangensis]MBX8556943.1 hypothetical protein [Pseudomonas cichorii]MBX8603199.1 hypothetical protein [Pseudomonas cichorii]